MLLASRGPAESHPAPSVKGAEAEKPGLEATGARMLRLLAAGAQWPRGEQAPALEGDLTAALWRWGMSPQVAHSQAGFRIELVASSGEAVSEELGLMGPQYRWWRNAWALPGLRLKAFATPETEVLGTDLLGVAKSP